MPIPVIKHYIEQDIQDVYLEIIHTILKSRFKDQNHLCLNQDQAHYCINQLDSHLNHEKHSISLNILEKETNYLFERWMISFEYHSAHEDTMKFIRNISEFISTLPLSNCRQDLYLITSFFQSDKQCYSYLSNQQSNIEFKSNSQLKAQRFQLANCISMEVVYDENIPTIDFMPWSKMQEQQNSSVKKQDTIHPLSILKKQDHAHPLNRPDNAQERKPISITTHPPPPLSIPTIVSPTNSVYTPFVAVRRLSRLSLSAMEDDTYLDERDHHFQEPSTASSIPIPGSSSRMQYTHNKRSTLAFSTSPTNNSRFLSPTDMFGGGERRNSLTDSHHHGCFVGSFEESLLSGRMSSMPSKPIMFHSQIGVLGYGECKPSLKCPPHWSILFPATFYKLPQQDQDYTPVTPYVGTVDIGDHALNELKKSSSPGYRIPPKGQLQVVIKNPNKTAVKLFLIAYDFTDMPKCSKTFLRQKSYTQGTKRLRYAIHVQICRTERKRIYLYKTMKVVFANQKMDAREKFDVVCEGPKEPVYIPL